MERRELPTPTLALVTDRSLVGGDLEGAVRRALAGGVNLVQLREKDLPAGVLFDLALRLREATRGRALLVVNDRVDVALACGAEGVQLPEEGLPVRAVRQLVGAGLLIGRSVHSVEGARVAAAEGADFLVFGTVYPSRSHPEGPAAGTMALRAVVKAVRVPVLGIGGITAGNVGAVMAAGACGVAVISAILGAENPEEAARALWEALEAAWRGQRVLTQGQ